ncbi:hypothetical protein MIR68_007288 [Amoeboaphelidium protococcarum]|nr:hypothetical protein MIR68_007288 [Amoeboaphelidium protococcarum]
MSLIKMIAKKDKNFKIFRLAIFLSASVAALLLMVCFFSDQLLPGDDRNVSIVSIQRHKVAEVQRINKQQKHTSGRSQVSVDDEGKYDYTKHMDANSQQDLFINKDLHGDLVSSQRQKLKMKSQLKQAADRTLIMVITSMNTLDRLWPLTNTYQRRLLVHDGEIGIRYYLPRPKVTKNSGSAIDLLESALTKAGNQWHGKHPFLENIKLNKPDIEHFVLLQNVTERNSHFITEKTFATFKQAAQDFALSLVNGDQDATMISDNSTLNRKDWFLKCDDDTYIIPQNLVKLYAHLDPNEMHYIGYGLFNQSYAAGGSGYIFSRGLITRMYQDGLFDKCLQKQSERVGEDVLMGRCIRDHYQVRPYSEYSLWSATEKHNSNDESSIVWWHHTRQLHVHMPNQVRYWSKWDKNYKGMVDPKTLDVGPVSFHYLKGNLMFEYDYLMYALLDSN